MGKGDQELERDREQRENMFTEHSAGTMLEF